MDCSSNETQTFEPAVGEIIEIIDSPEYSTNPQAIVPTTQSFPLPATQIDFANISFNFDYLYENSPHPVAASVSATPILDLSFTSTQPPVSTSTVDLLYTITQPPVTTSAVNTPVRSRLHRHLFLLLIYRLLTLHTTTQPSVTFSDVNPPSTITQSTSPDNQHTRFLIHTFATSTPTHTPPHITTATWHAITHTYSLPLTH